MGRERKISEVISEKVISDKVISEITSNKVSLKSLYHFTSRNTKRNKKGYTEQMARAKAQYLVEKLNNPSRFLFYLKCAWNLNDAFLDELLHICEVGEKNKTILKKVQYFSRAAAKEMAKNG